MDINDYASLFKALSEPVRLRILNLMLEEGEACVCHIVETLNLPQSVISRHLAYLRNNNLVSTRREGVWVFYRLQNNCDFNAKVLALLKADCQRSPLLQQDLATLRAITSTNCC